MSKEKDDSEKKNNKLVFLNHVDTYHGRHISKYLTGSVIGSTLEDNEEEEEEAPEGEEDAEFKRSKGPVYDIVGTFREPDAEKSKWIKDAIKSYTKTQLLELALECDYIIYDICEDPSQIDEATWLLSAIHAELENIERKKVFILISPLMTWAKTKPLDPEDPEVFFTEEDFRKRKPHPNFKDHCSAEKLVIKLGKTDKKKLSTWCVSTGLTYGCEENIFHYMFKAAWHNAPELHCFGEGNNVLPTMHIEDLAQVLQNVIERKPKQRYLVAVDDSKPTLYEIARAVSKQLSTGKVRKLNKEDALLTRDIAQADFDMLLIDLRIEGVQVKENMRIKWRAETGIVENIANLVKEYKTDRKLNPLRVCILGPPAAGKTTIGQQVAKHFKIHHLKMKDVIDEGIDALEKSVALLKSPDEEEEAKENEDEEAMAQAQEDSELLAVIKENREQNNNRLDDEHVHELFRRKLKSKPCQNQGFVIDGYPKRSDQAKDLFAKNGDGEEEEEEEKDAVSYEKAFMPEYLIVLDSSDEFLKERVMNLPENVVGTHNAQENFIRRLRQFRDENSDENTVVNYFDEMEVHPHRFDVSLDKSFNHHDIAEKIQAMVGKPRNYGPTKEEVEEARRKEKEEQTRKQDEERLERERKEVEEAADRIRRQNEWTDRLRTVKHEEHEMMETQSTPMRNYLMQHVMPTLTEALIECCKARPDDPVDYLAEYLFRHNPQVD